MSQYSTYFGTVSDYRKGHIEIIDDSPKNYVFSNIYEVAEKSAPFQRIAVAKNFEYVIETMKVENTSPWYACAHDEFALCMDGVIEVHYVKPTAPLVPEDHEGAIKLAQDPDGAKMGRVILKRGHMAILPRGSAYRFFSSGLGVLIFQTIQGPETIEKWADICFS